MQLADNLQEEDRQGQERSTRDRTKGILSRNFDLKSLLAQCVRIKHFYFEFRIY